MKTNSLSTVLVVVLLWLSACSEEQKGYEISNPFKEDIAGKAFVLSRAGVSEYVEIPAGDVVTVKDENGKLLPSQCDDLNGDGKWDELAFMVDLKKKEKKTVFFEAVETSKAPHFAKKTNIRFGDKKPPYKEILNGVRLKTNDSPSSTRAFQMEGPAWENDVVGFRNYFDARNGIDIFGKRTSKMVLDSVGLPGTPTYHELAGWGMDILKVGNSLGAGAIGISIGDILYRIGPSGEGRYKFICEGPVRAMLELTFSNVKISGRTYDIKHLVSIYAGDSFYRSKVTVSGLKGDEKLITGIVDHDMQLIKGSYKDMSYFYTLGPQAFLHEVLGMAIIVDKKDYAGSFSAPEEGDGIIKTHVVSLKIEDGKPVEFAFLAGWELQDKRLAKKYFFEDLIKQSILKLSFGESIE